MSLEELEDAVMDMPEPARAAFAKRLMASLEKPPSSRSLAMQALLAAWDAEDATDDPRELEQRRKDFEDFKKAMNQNRSSERPLYP